MLRLMRHNWPAYIWAAALVTADRALHRRLPRVPRTALRVSALSATWVAGASLAASWVVVARSPLGDWRWVRALFAQSPQRWAVVHSGQDAAPALRRVFPDTEWQSLDVRDATADPLLAAHGLEPLEHELDAAFVVLSTPHLTDAGPRARFFARVGQSLAPSGRMVVVEQLRDLPNRIAYGPGASQFLPRQECLRAFEDAELVVHDEFRMTPFVRTWVLAKTEG